MDNIKRSPVYLNILKIRMPVSAVVSVAHRISGILMVLFIPLLIYQLGRSLKDAESFNQVLAWLAQPLVIPLYILFAWSLSHHLFAGLRFLLIDLDIGVSRNSSQLTAWAVHGAALVCTALVAVWCL